MFFAWRRRQLIARFQLRRPAHFTGQHAIVLIWNETSRPSSRQLRVFLLGHPTAEDRSGRQFQFGRNKMPRKTYAAAPRYGNNRVIGNLHSVRTKPDAQTRAVSMPVGNCNSLTAPPATDLGIKHVHHADKAPQIHSPAAHGLRAACRSVRDCPSEKSRCDWETLHRLLLIA